jgi:hypothetical protein
MLLAGVFLCLIVTVQHLADLQAKPPSRQIATPDDPKWSITDLSDAPLI